VLPVERGAGLSQLGIKAAVARLNAGDWVHLFPEGTRTRDGNMGPIRKGIGRLVAACEESPLVVPFVHSGMDKVGMCTMAGPGNAAADGASFGC
jgi:monolysocardiolipin acyltransferase